MLNMMKKILCVLLCTALAIGTLAGFPIHTSAAMPTPTLGAAYDGLDFSSASGGLTNPNTMIYYGAHVHSLALQKGTFGTTTSRESTPTPVLWKVMGEEPGKNMISLQSYYVVDSGPFFTYTSGGTKPQYGAVNRWEASNLKAWMNNQYFSGVTFGTTGANGVQAGTPQNFSTNGFLEYFAASERNDLVAPNPLTLRILQGGVSLVTHSAYTPAKVWIPAANAGGVSWWASLNQTQGVSNSSVGYLKKGSGSGIGPAVQYWLRNPSVLYDDKLAFAAENGQVWMDNTMEKAVFDVAGIRPMAWLDPKTIVFASEIDTSGAVSSTPVDYTNNKYLPGNGGYHTYKLTLLGNNGSGNPYQLTSLKSGGNAVSASSVVTVASGASFYLTGKGNIGSADMSVNYKIVQAVGGVRKVVGYGVGVKQGSVNGSEQNVTIAARDLSGNPLPQGDYTAYVWLQKNNAITSHEASQPQYFTMRVGQRSASDAPIITSQPVCMISPGQQPLFRLTATSATPVTWSISGAPGDTYLHISEPPYAGTSLAPDVNLPLGTYTFELRASNGVPPDAVQQFTIFVVDWDNRVSGVAMNKAAAKVYTGRSETLQAHVLPLYAANQAILWSSTNTAVATVDEKGKVTGVAPGSTIIRATAQDSQIRLKYEECVVTVEDFVSTTGVSVSPASLKLDQGGKGQLTATVAPSNASEKDVVWSSANTAVCTVDATGMVTAVAPGTTTVKAVTAEAGHSASCTVTVNTPKPPTISGGTISGGGAVPGGKVEVTLPDGAKLETTADSGGNWSIKLPSGADATKIIVVIYDKSGNPVGSPSKIIPIVDASSVGMAQKALYLVKGKKATMKAAVYPAATTNKKLVWSSNKKSVATVNAKGIITAKKPGKATITAMAANGKKAKLAVTVVKAPLALESVKLSKPPKTVYRGQTVRLKAVLSPSKATSAVVTFSSKNPKVLKVDAAGTLTPVKKGKAAILVKAGGKMMQYVVNVK